MLATLGFSSVGCATEVASSEEAIDENEADLNSRERSVLSRLGHAVRGVFWDGSEGDPQQVRVMTVSLPRSASFSNNDALARAIGARVPELKGRNVTYGFQAGPSMAEFWQRELAQPDPNEFEGDADGLAREQRRATQMRAVKAIFDQETVASTNLVVGRLENGSIENGAVAACLVGRLPSGKLIVIYGIKIWT